jgi:tRNA-specific 2-thiouridylase
MSQKRVVVGLSGGVDSSVSAALLLEQGYEVIGVFMRNWHDETVVINQECPWIDDSNDAMLVAEHLGIPFQVLDLSGEYKKRIVEYMFEEYKNGFTPNPDILCNREIKFDVFLKAAEQLGADFVATGHYCQKGWNEKDQVFELIEGADENKDQSYFLCQISQDQLSKALFPIGHLKKSQVRELAEKYNLPTAHKKDSQGLCFVGKVKLPVFLQQQLSPKEGNVIYVSQEEYTRIAGDRVMREWSWESAEMISQLPKWQEMKGRWIGKHQGAHYYTVGQRKGLQIGGFKEPLFILHTDTTSNTVYVGEGENHIALYQSVVFVPKAHIHFLQSPDGDKGQIFARIRYRQALEKVEMFSNDEGYYFFFQQPQRAIAPGQFIAWYAASSDVAQSGMQLLGSGRMSER